MGSLSDDLIKIGIGGLIVGGLIKEAKGEKTCDYCGRMINKGDKAGMCQATHWDFKEGYVCSKCMKVCKKCNKIFCPKHINKHKCK